MKNGFLMVLGALALVGCGGGGGGGSSSSDARVTYVNASPDSGSLDFLLDGNVVAPGVAYGTTTSFKSTSAKDDDVSLRAADGSTDLWSESHTFGSNADSLVVAIGLKTPSTDSDGNPPAPELDKRLVLAYASVNRTAPVGNRARVLVVNALIGQAGTDTPAIDFRNPEDPPITNQQGLSFGASGSLDLDSGTANYQVRQNGTDAVLVASTSLTLAPGSVNLALISGQQGGTGVAAPTIRLFPITTRKP